MMTGSLNTRRHTERGSGFKQYGGYIIERE